MKINVGKVLSVVATGIGVAGTILSAVVDKNNRNDMKAEIKKEVLDELMKSK